MIVAAVILSGVLPGLSAFQNAAGEVMGIHIFGEVTLTFPALIEIVMILLAAFLSFKTTDKSITQKKPFYMGCNQRSRRIVYWYFCYDAAGTDAVEITWSASWSVKTAGNVLGDRCAVQFPG